MKKTTSKLTVMRKGGFLAIVGAALFGLSMGTKSAFAETTTISDGSNTGDVIIEGTLGADNKDESSNIPEGSDSWINVTVDTATIFYNTSSNAAIQSPNYTITNNSGRPVAVGISNFVQNNTDVSIESINSLVLNVTRSTSDTTDSTGQSTSTTLISSGVRTDFTTPTSIVTLANSNGKLAKGDTADSYGKAATFKYSGSTDTLSSVIKPEFTMTLLFTPQSWE